MDKRNRVEVIFIILICELFEIQQASGQPSIQEIWELDKKDNNPIMQAYQ